MTKSIRKGYATKFPALAKRRQLPHAPSKPNFSRVFLGTNENAVPVYLEDNPRLEMMHVLGTTGSGKTTFLKNILLQDFRRGRGGLVIDPHGSHPGSLFNELLSQLDADGFCKTGRVHVIMPDVRSHVLPINPLARLHDTDLSVIADALLQAFEAVWSDEDTHQKPTIRLVLTATFMALAELYLPFTEASLLYDLHDTYGVREKVVAQLENEYARTNIARLHQTSLDERTKRDFRAEVIGPINRLAEFTRSDAIKAMFGVVDEPGAPRRTFDFLRAMDNGDIILCNLQHGSAVSEADMRLLGAILLRYVFLLASRRTNREDFTLCVDECHLFLTGDVPSILAECRKFGIAAIFSHQFLAQLGKPGDLLYQALLDCAEVRAVFRIKAPAEAQAIAEHVLPLTLEKPVKASVRPTAIGHRKVRLASRSSATHESTTHGEAETEGDSYSTTTSRSQGITIGDSSSQTTGSGEFSATGENAGTVLTPTWQMFAPNAPTASFFPYALTESEGTSASRGTSEQAASSQGTSQAATESLSEAETHAVSRTASRSRAHSTGTSATEGDSEGFETIYADLPNAWHSKEHELYFAGELIRRLPTGRCFVAWRGQTTCVSVPRPKRQS